MNFILLFILIKIKLLHSCVTVSNINKSNTVIGNNRALIYTENCLLMATDFRDILFQSDPFLYHVDEWRGNYQLVLFKEFHPNMVRPYTLIIIHSISEILEFTVITYFFTISTCQLTYLLKMHISCLFVVR